MPNLLSVYSANSLVVPALAVAAIAIGVTVRVCLLSSPRTHWFWRSFFKTRHPQKN
jgi:hypothetical protein